jgi:hypothetical protein
VAHLLPRYLLAQPSLMQYMECPPFALSHIVLPDFSRSCSADRSSITLKL